ncbi:cytochrome P450 6A1-like [Musca vetustissima]|uniref:cytochrome P450 6A1-like n=1 Tax=Musca vetustissima TaxID=27455 RepID=UPI002AB69BE0|nr:cytochrome P450 6A1-like [Musca vetustissima]
MELVTLLFYLLTAIISLLVSYFRRNLNYWKNRGIPHDPPHLLLGNTQEYRNTRSLGEILMDYYKKYKGTGPFAGMYMGQRPVAVLLDIPTIKNVMIKDFNNFTDRGMYYNEKDDPLTGHLFFIDGQKWRNMRNKVSPAFTSGKMKFMYPTVTQVVADFMEVLGEQVQRRKEVEVRDLLGRLGMEIIGRVAFGIECNSLKNDEDDFIRLGRKSIEQQRHNMAIMAFIDSFPKLAKKLGMRILPEDVHQFFMKTIRDTVEYREKHKIQRNDFVNILIDLKNNKEDKSGLGGLTFEEMAAEIFVFFLAGFETSSSTVTFALFELAQNQEIQERLRQEVTETLEKYKEFTYESLGEMSYLNQVLCESLRKYPIVPFLTRRALNDYVIPQHPKYKIEAGTMAIIPVLGIHMDPELYPNPECFDPERFAPEMIKNRESVEWLGFGDGPRNCIGLRFGKLQSRLSLANMVSRYRFTLSSKTKIPLQFNPTPPIMSPVEPIFLNFEEI